MDEVRFDALLRSLSNPATRRGALRLLAGSAPGGLLSLSTLAVGAKKRRGKGKGKKLTVCHKGRTIRVRKSAWKGHQQHGDRKGRCSTQNTPSGPTCSDGIKNGSESDSDCGGSCPRCANGRTCASRHDCLSSLCVNNSCQACTADAICGKDADGPCACAEPVGSGAGVCVSGGHGTVVATCADCPPETHCFNSLGTLLCGKPCGAA